MTDCEKVCCWDECVKLAAGLPVKIHATSEKFVVTGTSPGSMFQQSFDHVASVRAFLWGARLALREGWAPAKPEKQDKPGSDPSVNDGSGPGGALGGWKGVAR